MTYAGSPVRLRCTVNQRATIHWSREGQPLPSTARIEEDYLELPRARPEDSGRYVCQIQTVHGVSSDYINLNVSRKFSARNLHKSGMPVIVLIHLTQFDETNFSETSFHTRCILSDESFSFVPLGDEELIWYY